MKSTKNILLILACSLLAVSCVPYVKCAGGVPAITGSVADDVTGKPVADAQLKIHGYRTFYTDEHGLYDIPAKWDWTFIRSFTPAGIIDSPYASHYSEFMEVSHPDYNEASVSRFGPDPINRQDFRHIRLTPKHN